MRHDLSPAPEMRTVHAKLSICLTVSQPLLLSIACTGSPPFGLLEVRSGETGHMFGQPIGCRVNRRPNERILAQAGAFRQGMHFPNLHPARGPVAGSREQGRVHEGLRQENRMPRSASMRPSQDARSTASQIGRTRNSRKTMSSSHPATAKILENQPGRHRGTFRSKCS